MEEFGDIDLLVNNVGKVTLESLLDTKPENFQKTFDVNVKSALVATQVAGRNMISRNAIDCSIVNISSQAGIVAIDKHTAYCMSKAAMNMLTKMTALELGPFGIRCNSICPTVVMTEMGRMAWGDEQLAKPMRDRIPLGRFAEVEEIVQPVLFLLSPASRMNNGNIIAVDGGFTTH